MEVNDKIPNYKSRIKAIDCYRGNVAQEQVLVPMLSLRNSAVQNCTLLPQLNSSENSSIGKKSFCAMTNFEVSL